MEKSLRMLVIFCIDCFIPVDCIDKTYVLLVADLIMFVPSTYNVNLFAQNYFLIEHSYDYYNYETGSFQDDM
jgi:hypothetical protein